MKKSLQFFLISIFCFILGSCSVYEDIYFNENGSVSYSLKYDASQILAVAPGALNSSSSDFPADTTFSILQMVEENRDSLAYLSDTEREFLEAIIPFSITMKNDTAAKILDIILQGDFTDAEAMNYAFIALNSASKAKREEDNSFKSNSRFDIDYSSSRYSWNGKEMTRTIVEKNPSDEPTENSKGYQEMAMMFSEGKMITRYHFPHKVKNISNSKALLSQDGKTVVIEQSSTAHINPRPEEFDIIIETE